MLVFNIDSDGVAANWEKYMLNNHFTDMENIRVLNKHPERRKLIADVYKKDPHVFRKLEPVPQFRQLLSWLHDNDVSFRILTACGGDHPDYELVAKDKRDFFMEHYGIEADKVIVTGTSADKSDYAGNNQVLIDDFDMNCEAWEENGGIAVEVDPNNYDIDKLLFVLNAIVADE